MSKKSIIFVSKALICGGIERALIPVLSMLPKDKYDITLLLTEKAGPLLSEVPVHVNVVEVPFAPLDRYELKHDRVPTFMYCLSHFHWLHAFRMLWTRLIWNLKGRKEDYNFLVIRDMIRRVDVKGMPTRADFALAYAGDLPAGSIVHYLIKAPVTAIWSHNESDSWLWESNVFDKLYAKFSHLFATEHLAAFHNKNLRNYAKRFEVMPLLVDGEAYLSKANEGGGFDDDCSGLRILTVCRLTYQKGIDEAIKVAARIKAGGLDFKWYVVGDGADRDELQRQIDAAGVGDRFVLLGEAKNPYPYFKQCDIYAQPSRWEAFCLAVTEAKAFCKPMIVTDFVGAREQIIDGETGLIVPVNDYDSFYSAVKRLLTDADLRLQLSQNLSSCNVTTLDQAKAKWKQLLS